ncbi:hypothetical protein O7630_12185 [Micromonospora sp. WMMD718]|uniref:hypothetical protein n=1 Tax=Micromonospora sp. WMMD718 TaxID=3016098 RepID=UPI002417F955|nr:hypothetical protein [Micromonospora sp. WMMD718]MDG4751702.1 hypothetical protein [Micromonospora sp. WMMD718]
MPETTAETETTTAEAGTVWNGEFDPERAARLVAALRRDLAEAKAKLEAKDGELTASTTRVAELEGQIRSRDIADHRAEVIQRHRIPEAAADFVTGETAEEIEASAAKVASALVASATLPELPKPRLTPGRAANDAAGDAYDPAELARRIA